MGWSVGADCIGWNESKGNYEFTLTDKQSNYMAIDDIKVNGKDYKKGDVLKYEDKTHINNNASEKSALAGKIYELPSTYNTILEYTRLGVPANKEADPGLLGYGVSPNTVANRADRFLSGKDCPFYMEFFSHRLSDIHSSPVKLWCEFQRIGIFHDTDDTHTDSADLGRLQIRLFQSLCIKPVCNIQNMFKCWRSQMDLYITVGYNFFLKIQNGDMNMRRVNVDTDRIKCGLINR